MQDAAYSAFYESVEEADDDPVRFLFTEEEVLEYDVPGEPQAFGDVVHNLSALGYPYLRAALIFEMMNRKT